MLELIGAIFLGIVQGLTEFLPVSSSGHLLLGQYFLGLDQDSFGLPFDAAIHTGTVIAVVSFFWRDLLGMVRAFLRSLRGPDFSDTGQRMAYLILVATVPASIIGFLFEDFFKSAVRNPWIVVFNLVLVGALFIVGEAVGRKRRKVGELRLAEVGSEGMSAHEVLLFASGCVSSGIVGYLAIRFLLNFLAGHSLRAFAYYRFGLAVVVAALLVIL